jgi:SAM-dependent methyltransferase
MLPHIPIYSSILSRVQSGGTFLDVGCFTGTDLRRLTLDGCPQTNLYGIDIVNHWDLDYELFNDREKFHAKYMKVDILLPNLEMEALSEKVDILSATHLLHNWDWDTQVRACCNLARFLKEGGMIVGFQVGTADVEKARWERKGEVEVMKFHTPETFERLWVEVERVMGIEWKCEVVLREWEDVCYRREDVRYLGDDARVLQFVVTRV